MGGSPPSRIAGAEKTQGDAVAPTRSEILDQLDRILRSPAFNKSQRYTAFLRYCVGRAVDGKSDLLKERSIGVDVFERSPDYDPGTDHVVRSAAAEVRKRLAQYYQDHAGPTESRIEVLPGSYVPQFSSAPVAREAPVEELPRAVVQDVPARRKATSTGPILGAAMVLALAVLALLWYRPWRAPTGVEWFWSPLLASPKQVTIFIGPASHVTTETDSAPRGVGTEPVGSVMRANTVSFASAASAAKISAFLQAQGKSSLVLSSVTSKFDDLQRGPAVLLGGLNNAWTLRLMDTLRFGFDDTRIRDRQRPQEGWNFDFTAPYQKVTRDYAVVSRVMHPATEQMTFIVAGLGQWGTMGAVDFITDPVRLAKLRESAPGRQRDANLQVVIGVDVVNGVMGPPKVLATYFW